VAAAAAVVAAVAVAVVAAGAAVAPAVAIPVAAQAAAAAASPAATIAAAPAQVVGAARACPGLVRASDLVAPVVLALAVPAPALAPTAGNSATSSTFRARPAPVLVLGQAAVP